MTHAPTSIIDIHTLKVDDILVYRDIPQNKVPGCHVTRYDRFNQKVKVVKSTMYAGECIIIKPIGPHEGLNGYSCYPWRLQYFTEPYKVEEWTID